MSLSLISEEANSGSFIEHMPDSLLNTTCAPTSVIQPTNNVLDDATLATSLLHDENQQFTNTVIPKVVSPNLQSTTTYNYGSDDCALIPLTLDSMTENQLTTLMLIKYEELLPTKENFYDRIALVQKIERLLDNEWPNQHIKAILFGSSVNHLGTNQSDVDICITTRWSGLQCVRTLARLFIQCGMQQVVCVPSAQVPIVRLFDPETQLACDININSTMALHNTKMIRTYIAIDPRVRPLAMIIKHWAKQRKLNDAADGGTLSTYTWTCMIINFLQMRQPPILPVLHQMKNDDDLNEMFCTDMEKLQGFGQANGESLGGLLFAFFRRYSIEFDYDDQVVSVRHGRYLTKQEKGWNVGRNKASLCVEEPFNIGRNLGNSVDARSVRGIRMELNRALEMLIAGVNWNHICSPYRPLTFGTFAPLYGSANIGYSAMLPSPGNQVNAIIASSYHRNDDNTGYSTMLLMTPPLSLSSSSSFSSSSTPSSLSLSSSLSSQPLSLPSSSPLSTSSPSAQPSMPLSPSHQYPRRSPSEQQNIIDAISAKYMVDDILPEQHDLLPRHTSYQRTQHHTCQKKNRSSRRRSNRDNRINSSFEYFEYPATFQGHQQNLATTTSHYRPRDSLQEQQHQHQHQHRHKQQQQQQQQHQKQQRRRRRSWSAKMTSEPAYCLDLLPVPSDPNLPYIIEIKLPTNEQITIDNGNISLHCIPPTSKLIILDESDDRPPCQQQQPICH